jgi:toxin ParE1/3/4
MQVKWTEPALTDLESIRGYIRKDSEASAELMVRNLFQCAKQISAFPESGRIVPEFEKVNVRELFFGSYRIIYVIKDNVAFVLSVVHGVRMLRSDIIK